MGSEDRGKEKHVRAPDDTPHPVPAAGAGRRGHDDEMNQDRFEEGLPQSGRRIKRRKKRSTEGRTPDLIKVKFATDDLPLVTRSHFEEVSTA